MEPVTSLNDNDVLFGRGTGPTTYIGNQRFRDLCDEHKVAYNSETKYKPKSAIATNVVKCIQSRGGRFLKLGGNEDAVDYDVESKIWYEVDDKEAREKTKQTLRQKSYSHESSQKRAAIPIASGGPDVLGDPLVYGPKVFPVLPPTLVTNASPDPRLMLFQPSDPLNLYLKALYEQQASVLGSAVAARCSMLGASLPLPNSSLSGNNLSLSGNHLNGAVAQQLLQDISLRQATVASQQQLHRSSLRQEPYIASHNEMNLTSIGSGHCDTLLEPSSISKENPTRIKSTSASKEKSMPADEDYSQFLASILLLSGLPRFTDHEQEKANMTDEERAAALLDMFGKYCNVDSRKNKRARRDLDEESIAFLVDLMRAKLEKIPKEKKQALMEAQRQCASEEFSDKRLERFLRCEGMDVEKAAQRFVNYWESRRELFGEEKYLMSMTLSGAVCDDLAALEAGWLCLLPKLDASGRQLLYMVPELHKNATESTVRDIWSTLFLCLFVSLHFILIIIGSSGLLGMWWKWLHRPTMT